MLFDAPALARVRDRAAGRGGSFLDQRIWEEVAERVAMLQPRPQSALLLGPLTLAAQHFAHRMKMMVTTDVDHAAGVDLLLAVRWAESEDDLPEKLAALAVLLPGNTPLLGASLGGDSLQALRAALLAADRADDVALPRSHPRIEPGALAELLQRAGFTTPVVDVEPVDVRYSSLDRLVGDLRDLGATNILSARKKAGVSKAWRARLEAAFPPGTVERFDILHFAGWTAPR